MRYRHFLGQALAGLILTLCRPLAADTVQVAVDPSQPFQTIEGFGALVGAKDASPTSNLNFGTPLYAQFAHDYSQDLGASMVRIELHPDALPVMPAGGLTGNLSTDVPLLNFQGINVRVFGNAAEAFDQQKLDQFRVFGSVWTPPAWMKANNANGALRQPDGGYNDPNNHLKFDPANPNNIDPATLTQFARYMAAYVSGFQQTFHLPMYAVSIQNEPMFTEPYNSNSYWQHYSLNPADPQFARYAQVVKAVGEEFVRDGISTRIVGPEIVGPDAPITPDAHGADYFALSAYNYITATKLDTAVDQYGKIANNYMYAYASHSFGLVYPKTDRNTWSSYANLLKPDGKPIWNTETDSESTAWYADATDQNGNPTHDGALVLARHLHEALAYGNVTAWNYLVVADGSPQDGYNLMDSSAASVQNPERTDAPNYKYDVVKHYAHFIRPGAVRIGATPADAAGQPAAEDPNGVNIDAYFNPATHRMTVELLNLSPTAQPADVAVTSKFHVPIFNAYLTDAADPWTQLTDVATSGRDARLTLPALSIVTLDGLAGLLGDLNGDGAVGFDDLVTLAQNYGRSGASYSMGDLDGSGTVDFRDLVLLAQNYGGTLPAADGSALPASDPVPEPAALALLLPSALLLRRRRRDPLSHKPFGRSVRLSPNVACSRNQCLSLSRF